MPYPEWLEWLMRAVQHTWWIAGVSYPARTAIEHGLGENYVAITGDGLLSLLFEIVPGETAPVNSRFPVPNFRYHNLYNEKPGIEGYPSGFGEIIHALGVRHGDVLTMRELLFHLNICAAFVNIKFDTGGRAETVLAEFMKGVDRCVQKRPKSEQNSSDSNGKSS